MLSKPITIRLSSATWEQAVAQAESHNTCLADWVRQVIGDALQQADDAHRFQQLETRLEQRMGEMEKRLMKEIQSLVSE